MPSEMHLLPRAGVAILLLVLLPVNSVSLQLHNFPPQVVKRNPADQYSPQGYVNDFAMVLNPEAESQLELICKDLDEKKQTQVAFVTIRSLDGLTSKDFATQLANRWGVGHKGTNRGILVLLALKERAYRISVGLGLETILSNEEADRLGKEMVPMLAKGDYGNALLHLAKRIQAEIKQKVK